MSRAGNLNNWSSCRDAHWNLSHAWCLAGDTEVLRRILSTYIPWLFLKQRVAYFILQLVRNVLPPMPGTCADSVSYELRYVVMVVGSVDFHVWPRRKLIPNILIRPTRDHDLYEIW